MTYAAFILPAFFMGCAVGWVCGIIRGTNIARKIIRAYKP